MSSIPLKHKCLSVILIWVIVSHIKVVVFSKKSKKKNFFFFFFFFTFLIERSRHGVGKKGGYLRLGMGPEIQTLEMGRKFPE